MVNEFHAHAVGEVITACVFGLAVEDEDQESEDADDELGGLFRVSRPDKASKQKADALECSKFLIEKPQDWDLEEVMPLDNCFCMSCLILSWLCLMKYDWVVIETDLWELWPQCLIFCHLLSL